MLRTLPKLQAQVRARIAAFTREGLEPWVSFQARGDIKMIKNETAWLESRIDLLTSP